jgi:hypothetical protein
MLNAIKHRPAFAFLYPKELIELVDLCTDVFTRLETHHDKLAILRRIQDCAERLVLLRCLFDTAKPLIALLPSYAHAANRRKPNGPGDKETPHRRLSERRVRLHRRMKKIQQPRKPPLT